jgi:dipeptidyl aminopeptidase/acylaminoacyl peptidase
VKLQRLALGLTLALTNYCALAAPPSAEVFGRIPAVGDADINPSGTRLAWIENRGELQRVVIHDLAAKRDLRTVDSPASTVLRSVYWANDDTLLLNVTITHSVEAGGRDALEWQRWLAVEATSGKPRMLLMTEGAREWVTGAHLVRRLASPSGALLMSTLDFSETKYRETTGSRLSGGRKDEGWITNLYEVDLKTGQGKVVATGTPYTLGYEVDASGQRIVRSEWDPRRDQFTLNVKDGIGWKRIYQAQGCGRLDTRHISTDGAAVIALGAVCDDSRVKLWSIPLDGSPMKALAEDAGFDIDRLIVDPLDFSIIAATFGGPVPNRWLDARSERRHAGLQRSFAGAWIRVIGRSADHQRVVVRVEDPSRPPIYYLVDYGAKSADIINEAYPALADVKLGSVREFKYEARDKYALMAYLTTPADSAGENLPMIVLPHGGPEDRDGEEFDWMAHFLASRGYAVLQPQFRGSTGLGREHAEAGRRQWGLRMQDDVTDGVRAAIAAGIADPKRICIAGVSYGGYSALAGAAFTPELYRCAASIGGVSDLPAMLGYETKLLGRESNSVEYWRDHIGRPTDENVVAKSPARSAATVSAPVLLLHGTEDTVVPIAQSRMMANALKAKGKPVELIELPSEDHWLSASQTRIRALTELDKFFARHLSGSLPATAAE